MIDTESGSGSIPCLALGCPALVPDNRLMCPAHYRMVPPEIRQAIYCNVRPGQTLRTASESYVGVAYLAVQAVAEAEGRDPHLALERFLDILIAEFTREEETACPGPRKPS